MSEEDKRVCSVSHRSTECGNTDEQCDRHYQHKVSREEEMLSVMNHLPIAAAEGKRLC